MIDIKRQEEAFEKLNRFKELNTLNNLSLKISDGIHSTPKYATDGAIPFVNGNNIRNGVLLLQNVEKFINEKEYELYKIQYLHGAILISLNGTIGEVGIYNNEKVLFGKSIGYINCTEALSNIFLMHYLKSEKVKSTFKKELTGSTIKNLSLNTLKNLEVPTYSSTKQNYIGKFLTSLDELIQKQEEYIEELKVQKKGYSQKIFNQELRFKGFEEEWKYNDLKEISVIKKGTQLNKESMITSGKYKVFNGGLEHSGYSNDFNQENRIIISEGGNSCGNIKNIYTKFWNGGHSYSLEKLKAERKYLFQYLKKNEENIMRLRIGSGIPNIQKKELELFKIIIPPQEEQQKIGNFLSILDDKIELQENKLEKLKLKKKYYLNKIFK